MMGNGTEEIIEEIHGTFCKCPDCYENRDETVRAIQDCYDEEGKTCTCLTTHASAPRGIESAHCAYCGKPYESKYSNRRYGQLDHPDLENTLGRQ